LRVEDQIGEVDALLGRVRRPVARDVVGRIAGAVVDADLVHRTRHGEARVAGGARRRDVAVPAVDGGVRAGRVAVVGVHGDGRAERRRGHRHFDAAAEGGHREDVLPAGVGRAGAAGVDVADVEAQIRDRRGEVIAERDQLSRVGEVGAQPQCVVEAVVAGLDRGEARRAHAARVRHGGGHGARGEVAAREDEGPHRARRPRDVGPVEELGARGERNEQRHQEHCGEPQGGRRPQAAPRVSGHGFSHWNRSSSNLTRRRMYAPGFE
jgi:hypothetical protein